MDKEKVLPDPVIITHSLHTRPRHNGRSDKANLPSASPYHPVHIWSTSEGLEERPAVRMYNTYPILATSGTSCNLKGRRSQIVTGRHAVDNEQYFSLRCISRVVGILVNSQCIRKYWKSCVLFSHLSLEKYMLKMIISCVFGFWCLRTSDLSFTKCWVGIMWKYTEVAFF